MLFEWLQYLTTPCAKHLRALGYPQEIIATQARYRRCKAAWRPHLDNTKATILESAAAARGNSCAVILGSGSLLDVPLAELSQGFKEVILVDILHLPWVKRRGLRYPNVRFHAMDVTGVCETLVGEIERERMGQGRRPKLPQVLPAPLADSLEVAAIDFLASVNLLSQLPIVPCAYLEKHCPACSDAERESFARALIRNHLLWLKASAEQVCLITDLERVICDLEGCEVQREGALPGATLTDPQREWHWDISPCPEAYPEHSVRHHVAGFLHLGDL